MEILSLNDKQQLRAFATTFGKSTRQHTVPDKSREDTGHLPYQISFFITYGAKLLNADWLRQRAFFLNHEGTFGNQEGMIT